MFKKNFNQNSRSPVSEDIGTVSVRSEVIITGKKLNLFKYFQGIFLEPKIKAEISDEKLRLYPTDIPLKFDGAENDEKIKIHFYYKM